MKIDDMNLDELHIELTNVRNDIQYLDEKLQRKRSWRSILLRKIREFEKARDLDGVD